jgi:Sec-independent protein translocase protein TatA
VRLPGLARALVALATSIAALAVWAALEVVVVTVLVLLSLVIGPKLREAADAVVGASRRARRAIGRARNKILYAAPRSGPKRRIDASDPISGEGVEPTEAEELDAIAAEAAATEEAAEAEHKR